MLLTHSDTLHAKQSRGFDQTTGKATRKLAELAARLERGRTRRDRAAVEADIAKITQAPLAEPGHHHHPDRRQAQPAAADLDHRHAARAELETELFGKRILVTSRDDWPVPEVVAGYRSQSDAEAGFRQLKDPRVVSFSPMHHWTDQKIRVHVSYCVTRPGRRPPDAPPSPPARPRPVSPGPAQRTRRHPGNRAALPLRPEAGPAPGACSPR